MKNLRSDFSLQVLDVKADSLKMEVEGLPVSLFEYPYPLLHREDRQGVALASVEDVALMKLVAILQRGGKKDFYDLHAIIIRGGVSLSEMISLLPQKFDRVSFQTGALLKALVYFKDADAEPPLLDAKEKWEAVKAFFKKEIKGLAGL